MSGYREFGRNTMVMDLLEYFNIVHLPSNFQAQVDEPIAVPPESDENVTEKAVRAELVENQESDLQKPAEQSTGDRLEDGHNGSQDTPSKTSTLDNKQEDIKDVEKGLPSSAPKDPFLVTWNGDNDPENPLNWSNKKKNILVIQVMFLTAFTYAGSSIYTPGQNDVEKEFGVGHVVGTLPLSIYVLGYGLGPLVFSPLSEVPRYGRLYTYLIALIFFILFQIPAATVQNVGGLIVVRFIAGFFCSPTLATGGATMGDCVSPEHLTILIGFWAVGAIAAPVLAPLLGAAMLVADGWRFIFWFLMIICTVLFFFLAFFFPETQHANILERRARRVRKETGDDRYYTETELEAKNSNKSTLSTIGEILYRPFEITALEPGVAALHVYLALIYGTYYLFFESFPLVFAGIYHFSIVEIGAAFLGFCVGCVVAYLVFLYFYYKVLKPSFATGSFTPETFLILAMWTCWFLPFSMFLFGWTAGVHWILPVIWEGFFVIGAFNIFQGLFGFLAMNYPRFSASVFAGNAFARSAFAFGFPLFGQIMYNNLGSPKYPIGWGSTLLGFITLAMCAIPYVLYRYGPALRGRSRFAD